MCGHDPTATKDPRLQATDPRQGQRRPAQHAASSVLQNTPTASVTADLVRTHLLLAFDVEGKER